MLVNLSPAEIVGGLQSISEAKELIDLIEKKIAIWEQLYDGKIPSDVEQIARINKIAAIKLLYETTGLSFVECKKSIEDLLSS